MINAIHKYKRYVKSVDINGNIVNLYYYSDTTVGWLATGFRDCNGKEIFEGDIVRNCFNAAVVTFKDGSFYLGDELLSTFARDDVELKVIGHVAEDNEP